MATDGIPDVYAKLQEILGAPVNLSAVLESLRYPTMVQGKGLDGLEVELVAVPAIPAKSESPKLTLWDHLLKDDV